jgi:hypothetical protein
MVRAKFRLARIECSVNTTYRDGQQTEREMRTLVFWPVSGGSEENKAFWDATPSGEVKLGTVNPEAWSRFELNREYYLDFTPAAAPA